jgi:hypothetical protein
LLAQHRPHVLQAKTETVQLSGVDLDAHGRECAATHLNLADAFDLQQALLDDGGRGIVKLAAVIKIRGECKDKDGESAGLTLR